MKHTQYLKSALVTLLANALLENVANIKLIPFRKGKYANLPLLFSDGLYLLIQNYGTEEGENLFNNPDIKRFSKYIELYCEELNIPKRVILSDFKVRTLKEDKQVTNLVQQDFKKMNAELVYSTRN